MLFYVFGPSLPYFIFLPYLWQDRRTLERAKRLAPLIDCKEGFSLRAGGESGYIFSGAEIFHKKKEDPSDSCTSS